MVLIQRFKREGGAANSALSVSAVVSDCQRTKRKLFRRADDAISPQGNRGNPQGQPEKGWRVIEEVNRGGSQAGSNRLFPREREARRPEPGIAGYSLP